MVRRVLFWSAASLGVVVLLGALGIWLLLSGAFGSHLGAGEVTKTPIPPEIVAARAAAEAKAATAIGVGAEKQIVFGDLHVHTTFSPDAFQTSLPLLQGDGVH